MTLLILGLLIWIVAHLQRSFAKGFRQNLQNKLGNKAKLIISLIILASLAMMIVGYKSAELSLIWVAPWWMIYVNNILMFFALYVYFTTATTKGTAFVMGSIENPQLVGFKIWANLVWWVAAMGNC